jgi:hypothetical protein
VLLPLANITAWDQAPHDRDAASPASAPESNVDVIPTTPTTQPTASFQPGDVTEPEPATSAPVVEAGTFQVANGGELPSLQELADDVRTINNPGLDQRRQSARQQTIDGFLQSLRAQAPPSRAGTGSDEPLESRTTTQATTIDPIDELSDVEELRSSTTLPVGTAAEDRARSPAHSADPLAQKLAASRPPIPPLVPEPPEQRPWSDFFHFPAGTAFRVDGPLSYNGNGTVVERTEDLLKFELHMPETEIIGQQLPRTDLVISVTYAHEGAGNAATIEVNGRTIQDPNVTIQTDGDRRRIIPSVSIPGVQINEVSISRDDDEIDLDITIDNRSWDFDLELDAGASEQS